MTKRDMSIEDDLLGERRPRAVVRKTSRLSSAGDKVTVACKLPHGLEMRVFKMVDSNEPDGRGGRKDMKIAEKIGDSVTLHPAVVPFGFVPKHRIIGGYSLTTVDKDFWTLWREQNATTDYVRNELVFAWKTPDGAEDAAEERSDIRSGLEPLVPPPEDTKSKDVDPRLPRASQNARNVGRLQPAERS